MSLDGDYGRCLPPQSYVPDKPGSQAWEDGNFPQSLSKLGQNTATHLKAAMDQVAAGWKLGKVAMTGEVLILWLVDAAGQLWFAIEELVLRGTPMGIPKHQKCELHANADKLGHPAFVQGANARIGGEIYFDPTRAAGVWMINNKSGRYGLHKCRSEQHLQNANEQFYGYGILLQHKFITRR